MGGDEFMLIGWDLTEEEAEAVKKEWEEALAKLNEAEGEIECVIACGLAYGGEGHDLQSLLKTADERMYENKVAIKKFNQVSTTDVMNANILVIENKACEELGKVYC